MNIIHYNVMLNTCKTTKQALAFVKEAVDDGVNPSERTCLKLAKLYVKDGKLPGTNEQIQAVMSGLRQTCLFQPRGDDEPSAAAGPAPLPFTPSRDARQSLPPTPDTVLKVTGYVQRLLALAGRGDRGRSLSDAVVLFPAAGKDLL